MPQRKSEVTVTLRLPVEWARYLRVLIDPEIGMEDISDVLTELADHAQQGVCRPGSWEREWLCQAFGFAWTESMEPDPDVSYLERPSQGGEDW
jgi:hypothetical protein